MVPKSFALFGLAAVIIIGTIMVSACTGTVTPTATPAVTPTATPSPGTMAVFNQSDNNKTVEIKNGETFKVILDENPSTGYSWNVSVTSGLTIVNDTYLPPVTDLLGVSGMHEWHVKATGTGDQQFSGVYKRPWEPVFGNETTYVLNVKVV
jgi:inhibitor of cysteine peptidase